ncbi:prostatic acid phosphatase-like isoform X2 [Portunus trituberculatus]|uniref:prostatic acid phosphatase-like isoform X2 n=1 Tax=Portunus trituberculatus TaxID=210409 RepID=UPI001E1CD9B5|nr:prostatic acid phosphatase-like isoform X2 [Portunus trituberculatus]
MTTSPLPLLLLLFLSFLDRHAWAQGQDSTLQLVQMLYRHGDRSPISLYPNDPHGNVSAVWPMGLGQLTKKGKAMHYELGRWLRTRYDTLVGPDWVPEELIVRSSDTDRTLMSAACNLAAFYFPKHDDERFEKHLPWMPTPIHTIPAALDKLILIESSCPRVKVEEKNMDYLPEVKKILEENQDLFKFLTEKTGQAVDNITAVSYIFDTLMIESAYNLTLPSWTKDVWDRMERLHFWSFKLMAYTPELKRLRGGPLIKEFGDNMRKKVAGSSSSSSSSNVDTKIYMYSGHDATLAIVTEALGVYNGLPPPYAALFLLELHKVDDQYFVKMYYHNDTAMREPPYPLVLPGCSEQCLLDDWLSLTAKVVSDDWDKECHSGFPFGLSLNTFAGNQCGGAQQQSTGQ